MRKVRWRWVAAPLSALWTACVSPYVTAIVTDPHMDGSSVLFVLRLALLPAALPWLIAGAASLLPHYAVAESGVAGTADARP